MKLVTYNTQYSRGRDERYDLARIADAVRGADVVALQEVERFWPRSGMQDQPARLGELLPDYYWVYGPAFDIDASAASADGTVTNRRQQFGNMLLSKHPILSSRLHAFPKFDAVDQFNMEMGPVEGVIDLPGGALRFYSVHLNHHSTRERLLQLDYLLEAHRRAVAHGSAWTGPQDGQEDWWAGQRPPPVPADAVLMGDFNSEPESAEYDRLCGSPDRWTNRVAHADGFVDSWVAAGNPPDSLFTWHNVPSDPHSGAARLDYCFLSSRIGARVTSAEADLEAQGSDHYPYWIELDW